MDTPPQSSSPLVELCNGAFSKTAANLCTPLTTKVEEEVNSVVEAEVQNMCMRSGRLKSMLLMAFRADKAVSLYRVESSDEFNDNEWKDEATSSS